MSSFILQAMKLEKTYIKLFIELNFENFQLKNHLKGYKLFTRTFLPLGLETLNFLY